jgi:hypothetical protein
MPQHKYEDDLDAHEADNTVPDRLGHKKSIRARATANVKAAKTGAGGKSAYVSGPRGGADTATRIGHEPPPTRGPRTVRDLIGYVTGRPAKERPERSKSTSGATAEHPDAKPKTDVGAGLRAISARRGGALPSAAKPKGSYE